MHHAHHAALIVGHPGHELRVHGWLSQVRPVTFVLTTGSGATGFGRSASTELVLRETGVAVGNGFAPLDDGAAYAAILRGDAGVFVGIADAIARQLSERGITLVAGDAWEGYNPVHDVCRLVIDAAVIRTGRTIENWSFPLDARPDTDTGGPRLVLDDAAFEQKMAAADRYRELAPDVAAAIRDFGREAFRTEAFTRVTAPHWDDARFDAEKPFYETHGEKRVLEGKYRFVIRFREHIRPIAEALRAFACAS